MSWRDRKVKPEDTSGHWRELSLNNPILRVLLICLFVGAVVTLLRQPPDSDELDLDKFVEGGRAPSSVISNHGFHWEQPSQEPREDSIRDAVAAVLPVLDHDIDAKERMVGRIATAFRAMRRNLRLAAWEYRSDQLSLAEQAEQAEFAEQAEASPDDNDDIPNLEALQRELSYEEWISVLSDSAREEVLNSGEVIEELVRHLQRSVRPELRATLAREGFSEELELLIRRILTIVMDRPIVVDRAVVEATAPEGVALRSLSRQEVFGERSLRDLSAVVGQEEIPALIERSAGVELSTISDDRLAVTVSRLIESLVGPNAAFNLEETEARRRERANAVTTRARLSRDIRPGDTIIAAGDVVTADSLSILELYATTRPTGPSKTLHTLGLLLLTCLIIFPLVIFARQNLVHTRHDRRNLVMMGTLLVLHLLLTRGGIYVSTLLVKELVNLPVEAFFVLVPFATGAMTVRILNNAESSLIYAVIYSLLVGFLFDSNVTYVTYALVAGIAGSAAVSKVQTRRQTMGAGLHVGMAMAGVAISLPLIQGTGTISDVIFITGFALISGLISAALVNSIAPLFETLFGFTSTVSLLELTNSNQPLLRKLAIDAPGSYHHSLMVSELVEIACSDIKANALLGKVGALYHDIGKLKDPEYFAENQGDYNPLNALSRRDAAAVIKGHVSHGVVLAKAHKLPSEIIAFINEHHGTSLIRYFYKKDCDERGAENVNPDDYRYDGPKPQTKETAICLLADGIEARSKADPDKSPEKIAEIIEKQFNHAISTGQLSECDLTSRELSVIKDSFARRLNSAQHKRPVYPSGQHPAVNVTITQQTAAAVAQQPETQGAAAKSQGQAQEQGQPAPSPTSPAARPTETTSPASAERTPDTSSESPQDDPL